VVRAVDLQVARGEFLALIGESGSGKTTLLRLINRLIEPTAGAVSIDGRDAAGVPPEVLRRGIGYVLQAGGIFPHWTVGENVGAVPRLLGWEPRRIAAKVDELLAIVGLAEHRDRMPDTLSGGQRQRVGVARALAASPPILLMDEPFGALDPVTRDRLQDDLRGLHEKLQLTTVMVTHDMAEALRLADRIAVLDGGAIVRIGTPRELLADPGHERVAALLDAPRRHAALLASLT
jgi:osmoprotectant transport system ATP-binding protein